MCVCVCVGGWVGVHRIRCGVSPFQLVNEGTTHQIITNTINTTHTTGNTHIQNTQSGRRTGVSTGISRTNGSTHTPLFSLIILSSYMGVQKMWAYSTLLRACRYHKVIPLHVHVPTQWRKMMRGEGKLI